MQKVEVYGIGAVFAGPGCSLAIREFRPRGKAVCRRSEREVDLEMEETLDLIQRQEAELSKFEQIEREIHQSAAETDSDPEVE